MSKNRYEERITELEAEVKMLQAQIDKMTIYQPNPNRHNYWYYPTLEFPTVSHETNTAAEVLR